MTLSAMAHTEGEAGHNPRKYGKKAKKIARGELYRLVDKLDKAERQHRNEGGMSQDSSVSLDAIVQKIHFSGRIWQLLGEIGEMKPNGDTADIIGEELDKMVSSVRAVGYSIDKQDMERFAGMIQEIKARIMRELAS